MQIDNDVMGVLFWECPMKTPRVKGCFDEEIYLPSSNVAIELFDGKCLIIN